jgi:hypothetical protein
MTHSNLGNYYSMQFAASFFDASTFYFRNTNDNGLTPWAKVWNSLNDGAGSGLDADLLDGQSSAAFQTALGYTPVNEGGHTMTGTLNVGANVHLTTVHLSVGNTIANLIANSIIVKVANATATTNVTPDGLKVGATTTVNTAGFFGNGAGLTSLAPTTPTWQVFTANGTWTKPTGCRKIKVVCTGAGGGGGGAAGSSVGGTVGGGGGGGGGTAIKYVDVTSISSQTVTIGLAGTAGAATGGTGGTGATSTFGAQCSAAGGVGGTGAASQGAKGGGAGGAGSSGDLNVTGSTGGASPGNSAEMAGPGGDSFWGSGAGIPTGSAVGVTATSYGGGGSGAFDSGTTNRAGGAGFAGVITVEEFY